MIELDENIESAAAIVRDAGGKVVGRTRLQKVAYLLELIGLGAGYRFEYRYGLYSEELAEGVRGAWIFDLISETECSANWGGTYSVFESTADPAERDTGSRACFAEEAASMNAIDLELAATAAYLNAEGHFNDPWSEMQRRKPDKADRLASAKEVYSRLRKLQIELQTPNDLPNI